MSSIVDPTIPESSVENDDGGLDIVGMDGVDRLNGSKENDEINTLGGRDQIDAGAGDDQIRSGSGADRVLGGTGNDFVMIDDRLASFDLTDFNLIGKLCNRRFGVGADGVILIRNAKGADFEMIYFNPDGSQYLCGNGSRCAVMFARALGIIDQETTFLAIDGKH